MRTSYRYLPFLILVVEAAFFDPPPVVAAATAPGGGQQERKQYQRSTTSYGLRKLPKPPGCRKCKGNARGCRIKDHQLEDASDEQVRSSSVLLY